MWLESSKSSSEVELKEVQIQQSMQRALAAVAEATAPTPAHKLLTTSSTN